MPKEDMTSFLARIEHHNRCRRSQIKGAYKLAKDCFRGHWRKQKDIQGKPIRYFEHLRGTALNLMDRAECLLPEMIIAALMHDALEDARDITEDDIHYWHQPYSWEVLRIVRILSKNDRNDYLSRLRTYGDWKILLIKACDRLHNLSTLEGCTQDFQREQGDETLLHYIHLLNRMFVTIPYEYELGAACVMFEIEELAERYCTPGTKIPSPNPRHWRYHLRLRRENKRKP